MSTIYNPSLPQGLVLNLDAANRKSHIEAAGTQQSFLNVGGWTTGTTSSTPYNVNETVAGENQRLIGTDPWGNSSIVWQSNPSGDGNGDGGWNTDGFTIDPNKMYRHSIWMRRTSTTTGGTFYFGTSGNVKQMSDSVAQGNPYWSCANISAYTQNQWYLFVGHTYPWNTTYTGKHPDTGYYAISSNSKLGDISCNIGSGDVKWDSSTASYTIHRTYHYYCGDNTSHCQWAFPRIDLVDGTEPSIIELLKNGGSQWKDLSSTKAVGTIINNPAYSRTNGGQVIFNGSNSQYIDCGNPETLKLTTEMSSTAWIYPTSVSTNGNIVAKNANSGYRYRINSDNSLWFYVAGNAINSAANLVPNNTWTHVAVVGDGNGLRGYVNGIQVVSNTTHYTPTDAVSGNVLIGTFAGSTEFFTGSMGQVKVYNRGLSAAEVIQDFNSSKKRYGL